MPELRLRITDEDHNADVVPQVGLLGMCREHLWLTDARMGCDRGACGACTLTSPIDVACLDEPDKDDALGDRRHRRGGRDRERRLPRHRAARPDLPITLGKVLRRWRVPGSCGGFRRLGPIRGRRDGLVDQHFREVAGIAKRLGVIE